MAAYPGAKDAEPDISDQLHRQLSQLLADSGGRWRVSDDGKALEAQIHFKTFQKTWEFMNLVAAKASEEKHHPEWSNVYNKIFVRWTTHSSSSISEKDVRMACFCNDGANALGALHKKSPESNLGELLRQVTKA